MASSNWPSISGINVATTSLTREVLERTDGWGANLVFECSGVEAVAAGVFEYLCPGGTVVLVGMPGQAIPYDVVAAQVKEATVEHVFRYAHVFPRALDLMGSGAIDLKPLITDRFQFSDSVRAFEFAADMPQDSVKAVIELD